MENAEIKGFKVWKEMEISKWSIPVTEIQNMKNDVVPNLKDSTKKLGNLI